MAEESVKTSLKGPTDAADDLAGSTPGTLEDVTSWVGGGVGREGEGDICRQTIKTNQMMLKLTSQIENVFGNISDVIRHVLETKRNTRKEKKGKNMTEISAITYMPEMLKMLEDRV